MCVFVLDKLSSSVTNNIVSLENCVSVDFYGTGGVIGEMEILGLSKCNLTVECETDIQAFFIKEKDLCMIMSKYPSVEERLWRVSGIHTATRLLAQLPEYQVGMATTIDQFCLFVYLSSDGELFCKHRGIDNNVQHNKYITMSNVLLWIVAHWSYVFTSFLMC